MAAILSRASRISRTTVIIIVFIISILPADAVVLEFWHPWPHADRTVRSLAARYRQQTGVTVRVRTFQPTSYSPWRLQGGPDVVGLYRPTKVTVENLVRQGRVYNLESEMARGWYYRFYPGMLETFRISSGSQTGIYGVPLTGQVYVFVYNTEMFRRAGISRTPRTWSELMSVSSRIRRLRAIPYAGGFGSNKPALAHAYERSYIGLHNLLQTYNGRYSYTSQNWIQYLNLYSEMRRYGFTNNSWAAMSEASATKAFLDGRVAMIFVGPGFESIRRAYKPGFKTWGIFGVPVDSRARFLPRLPGGVVEGVVISSRSSQKTQAIRFTRWLTETPQQVTLANGASSIPATLGGAQDYRLQQYLRLFASGMRDQAIDLRVYERPQVLTSFYNGVRGILAGTRTPTVVARQTALVKRR